MTRFGYTLTTDQSGPRELVGYAERAEEVGFDLEVCSDHYFRWLESGVMRRTPGVSSARSASRSPSGSS